MTTSAGSHDVVILHALVLDGAGGAGVVSDVGVDGDRVSHVGGVIGPGRREIDASGLVLTPGFIDVHTHDDWALLSAPDLSFETLQGVTTIITGNCGMSPAPISNVGLGPAFGRMNEYFSHLEDRAVSVNVASLVGHGTIRSAAIGESANRPSDRSERLTMVRLLQRRWTTG